MKEYLLRKGYELRPTNFELKWYHWILYFWFIDVLLFYRVEFIDFVNSKGKVRRVYLEVTGE